MKTYIQILILILSCKSAFAQSDKQFKFRAKPDTIIEKNNYGYIYITSDTSSKLYRWIIPNPNEDFGRFYTEYINHIKQSYKQKISHFPTGNFPKKWNAVYFYNKNYFLYAPSDWMNNWGYYLSDSVLYITNSDPNDIYVITNFSSQGIENANIKVKNYFGENKSVEIQLISKHYGIYRWSIKDDKSGVEEKFIMQNSDFSKRLPMIVCDCGERKCIMEFDFEKNK